MGLRLNKAVFKVEQDGSVKKKRTHYLCGVERKCLHVPTGKRGCFKGGAGTHMMGNPLECVKEEQKRHLSRYQVQKNAQ